MTRGPLTFRQQDLVRALKGAKAAGFDVAKVWIEKDGKIVLGFTNSELDGVEPKIEWKDGNPWDKALCHEDQ
jgi:hypothetical protein